MDKIKEQIKLARMIQKAEERVDSRQAIKKQDIEELSEALDTASRLMRLFSLDAITLKEKVILNRHIANINGIRNTVRMNYFWSAGESIAFPEIEKAHYPDGQEIK